MNGMNSSTGSYSEFRGRALIEQDDVPSGHEIISGKAYFPPDMRQSDAKDLKKPMDLKLKAALVAAGVAIGSMLAGIVLAADGLVKVEKAWTIVVDRWTDRSGVEEVKAIDIAFNEHTKPLYAVLSPALKNVRPTIDTIVAAKYQPAKRDLFVQDRQTKAKDTVLSNSRFRDSASILINEFDTAAACLNSKECNEAAWHENFDGAFCGAQRTYSHFVDLQRQRLPTFATEYSEALKSIDCVAVLYK